MITTEKMMYVTGVVLEEDVNALTGSLLTLGILDFVNIRDISPHFRDKLRVLSPSLSAGRLEEAAKRIHHILGKYGLDPGDPLPTAVESMDPTELEEIEAEILAVTGMIEGSRKKREALTAERKQLEEIQRQVRMFGNIRSGIQAQSSYSFLSIRTGTVPDQSADPFTAALAGLPSVLLPASGETGGRPVFLLITMKKDENAVRSILDRFEWTPGELPAGFIGGSSELDGTVDTKIATLRREENELDDGIRSQLTERLPRIREILGRITVNRLVGRIQSSFSKTDRTVLFSGWLPDREQKHLEEAVRSATAGRYYLEWSGWKEMEADNMNAPVQLRNPSFLLPFEKLVKNYAIPEYGTIDPTPFVAVAYVLMFGLMFGDAGHGLVLLLIGILGTRIYKKKGKPSNLPQLITWCGAAAVASGILFGSYFGFELLPPLWFPFHAVVNGTVLEGPVRSIFDILKITIYFGIGVIGTGLVLNWINLCLKRRWFPLLFDKGGLVGGWIYAAGVYLAFYFVRHDYRQMPPASFILAALVLPFLFLALKAPVERAIHAKQGKKERITAMTPVIFIMEWLVEILEITSGYLANTLSFMRVAGLGIAHVSLMAAFFQIADMASGGRGYGNLAAIGILVLGNVLVIALEGLSAGIQSLRLNYYEFFSKYFSGSGREYTPVSLGTGNLTNR